MLSFWEASSLLFLKRSIDFLDLSGDTIRNGLFLNLSSVSFNDAIVTFILMLLRFILFQFSLGGLTTNGSLTTGGAPAIVSSLLSGGSRT